MFLLPLQLFEYFYSTVTNASDEFMVQQNFSLPKPIINYSWKNIESPNVYQKILESCKYFNSKKSCVLLKKIKNQQNKWIIKNFKDKTVHTSNLDIRKYDGMKIWITDSLEIEDFDNIEVASEIMPKVYRCDIQKLFLWEQNLLFNEFVRLTSKVEECIIYKCYIKYGDNEEVPFEIIFECFPAIKLYEYKFSENTTNFNAETMEKVMKLSNFQNIEIFELYSIPTNFDILSFYIAIKEAKSYKQFSFRFCEGMPEDFQNQIIAINDEILKMMKNIDFVFPYIRFPEYDNELDKFLDVFQCYISRKYTPRVIKKKDCGFLVMDTMFGFYLFLGIPNYNVFEIIFSSLMFVPPCLLLTQITITKFLNSFM